MHSTYIIVEVHLGSFLSTNPIILCQGHIKQYYSIIDTLETTA